MICVHPVGWKCRCLRGEAIRLPEARGATLGALCPLLGQSGSRPGEPPPLSACLHTGRLAGPCRSAATCGPSSVLAGLSSLGAVGGLSWQSCLVNLVHLHTPTLCAHGFPCPLLLRFLPPPCFFASLLTGGLRTVWPHVPVTVPVNMLKILDPSEAGLQGLLACEAQATALTPSHNVTGGLPFCLT